MNSLQQILIFLLNSITPSGFDCLFFQALFALLGQWFIFEL
jgi:hypothetical protein